MKIVNCALLYADGDKYVWSVVTEGAEDLRDFPIDLDLVADGSIWENDGIKYVYVLEDEEWKKEESGGGMSFADVTFISSNGAYRVQGLITEDNEGFPRVESITVTNAESVSFSVLLGSNGKARIYGEQFVGTASVTAPTTTGDITFTGNYIEISGDGTITAKGTGSN